MLCRKTSYPSVNDIIQKYKVKTLDINNEDIYKMLCSSSKLIHDMTEKYFISSEEEYESILGISEEERKIFNSIIHITTDFEREKVKSDIRLILKTSPNGLNSIDILKILLEIRTDKIKAASYQGESYWSKYLLYDHKDTEPSLLP